MSTGSDTPSGAALTLREKMRAAGLSDRRIASHAEANAILLNGELVGDNLDQSTPPGSRWHFTGR